MKKILAIAMALVLAMALSVSVFADDVLYTHDFSDGHADGWWEDTSTNGLGSDADLVAALQTDGAVLRIYADFSGGGQWGFQSTVSWKNVLVKTVDDPSDADNQVVYVPAPEGEYLEVAGATVIAACDQIGCDLSGYNWINGSGAGDTTKIEVVVPAAAEPEATETETTEPETTETAPETTETTTETTTEETASAPSTGLALAVVPAVVALAAAVVSKKR